MIDWIPVSTPPTDHYKLLMIWMPGWSLGYFTGSEWRHRDHALIQAPTHWAELPAGPNGER